jgi:hypothetical protein
VKRSGLVLLVVVGLTLVSGTSAAATPSFRPGPGHLSRALARQKARAAIDREFFIDFSGGHRPVKLRAFHRYSPARVTFRFFTYFTNTGIFSPTEEFACFGRVVVAERRSGSIEAKVSSAKSRGSACGSV